jgi:uncharacterized protein (DUF433 family)
MKSATHTQWVYLEPRPKSVYRQLFVKGTRIRAEVLYGLYVSEQEPMTAEQIASEYGLPVKAVQEAIAYCAANPPEIERDFRMEEALFEATGMNDPNYRLHPTPKLLSEEERTRIHNL